MNTKYSLRSLEASGFRGIGNAVTLNFHPRATIIVAPNGTGKTSLLGAIEWSLFGALQYQPKENATNDEIVNMAQASREARVRLELFNEDHETLYAVRTKRVKQRATQFTLDVHGVKRYGDDEAEIARFRHLGLTFEDFYRAVYLHQESIRGLLLDEPRVRNEALDRLFGVDKLRDILRVLTPKPARDAIAALTHTKQLASARLEGSIREVNAAHDRVVREVEKSGLVASDLNLDMAIQILRDMEHGLRRAAELVDFSGTVDIEIPASLEMLERGATKVRSLVKSIRNRGIQMQLDQGTGSALAEIERAQTTLISAQATDRETRNALADCLARVGDEQTLATRRDDQNRTLQAIAESLDRVAANQRLSAEAVRFLQVAPDATTCPVCGQAMAGRELLARLQGSLEDTLRSQLQDLDARRIATKATLADIDTALQEISRHKAAVDVAQRTLDKACHDAEILLGISSEPSTLVAALASKAAEMQEKAGRVQTARSKAEFELDVVDGQIDRVRLIYRYLQSAENRLTALSTLNMMDSDESTADEQIDSLANLERSIQSIAMAVQEVASEHARTALMDAQDEYARYYATLCNHPYFDRLRITVDAQNVRGTDRNNYVIQTFASADGGTSLASSRLSTAQMNCVALSVYLALAERLEHQLNFIILDDPSQSLDDDHKRALIQVLDELDPRLQFVIATQDVEFGHMLRGRWPGAASAYYTLQWSSTTGTQLRRADG